MTHGRMPSTPLLAGVAYSVSWVAGLLIFSASTDVRSSGAELLTTYSGHRGVAMAQFVLTEGIPALALALVVLALARAAAAAGEPRLARAVLASGLGVWVTGVGVVLGRRGETRMTVPGEFAGP